MMRYQIGRYISSNEAVWRIFGLPVHEQDPALIHLAIHLENGQRAFFTNETAIERAMNPQKTTFAELLKLCNRAYTFGAFAQSTTLFHMEPNKKNGCPANKAHQLMCAPAYSNQTLWIEYIQSIQDRVLLSVSVAGYCHRPIVISRNK
jgi:hypothetical protein